MLCKQQLRFAQKVVRKGWVKGGEMLECIELLNSRLSVDESTLIEILLEEGHLSQSQVREIERELSKNPIHDATGKALQSIGGYDLLEKLGEGAMGTVYKARKKSDNLLVALKLLDQELAQDQEFINRFLREARNVAKLRKHENIVEAYDFGEDNGRYYFVMEFIDGRSLAEILYSGNSITERLALTITRQIARALNHAHSFSIIHRDIKPENIIISSEGIAKLCDLGLAKDLSEDFYSTGGVTLGTVYYASPEQARGSKNLDVRSDIYSLGISLYHMLAGELPFSDTDVRKVAYCQINEKLPPLKEKVPNVSRKTRQLVGKMTRKEAKDRHQNPQELLDNLDVVLGRRDDCNVEKKKPTRKNDIPPGNVVFKKRKLYRRPSPILCIAVLLALLLIAAVFFAFPFFGH